MPANAPSLRYWLSGSPWPLIIGGACVILPMCGSTVAMLAPERTTPVRGPVADRGSLAFDQYLVNLGEVPPQPVVRARFGFTNRGSHPVVIERLEPSCGCLQPKLLTPGKTIAPGQRSGFLLHVRTFGEAPGLHEYHCDVHYRDDRPRVARVYFRVRLPRESVVVRPRALIVYQSSQEPTDHRLTIENLTATPLEVLSVETRESWLRAEALPGEAEPAGTGGAPEPLARAEPAGRGTPSKSRSLPENVAPHTPQPTGGRDEQVRLDAMPGPQRQFVHVRITNVPPGTHDTVLVVNTTHPQFRTLTVPVRVYGPRPPAASRGTASGPSESASVALPGGR